MTIVPGTWITVCCEQGKMQCLVFFLLSLVCLGSCYTPPAGQTVGQPWPLPQSLVQTQDTYYVSDYSFAFNVVGQSCDILEAA